MQTNEKENAVEYPTGYTSSALPFYQDLDDQKFERFCTDLLNLHPLITLLEDGKATQRKIQEATHLLSGNPQKGADVCAKDDQGEVWIFQCKHTKNFGPADVLSAIELAEKGSPHAGQYVLVITCGLSKGAQEPLDARPNWRWWDASRLTIEVQRLRPREDAINLVHRYFGPKGTKLLFPCSDHPLLKWKDFFHLELASDTKHFRHTFGFVPWSDALSKLEEFAQSAAGRALILSAPGGQGKSRLLLELAHRLEKQSQAPRVRFLNLNQHGLSGEQSDFLAREEGDLLLIVDDAHRMGAAIQDVARAAAKVKSIRLLIATRPQAVDAIRSQLYQNGYDEKIEEPLRLPPWQRDHIRQLAEQVLDSEHRSQAPVLASLADLCPLLVVLGAGLVNSGMCLGTLTEADAFRERVFKSFKDDFLMTQPEARRERLSRVISFLSFVSPARKNDALLNNAAEILGCSQLDIDHDLGMIEAAGLVVENWEGIRLYPDLFADAVLLDTCLDPHNRPSQLHKTVLDKLKITDFPSLMQNVAQADWESRSRKGTPNSLFDPIWEAFIVLFEKAIWDLDGGDVIEQYLRRLKSTDADRREMLDQWARVAIFLPERTFELTKLILKSASENERASVCRYYLPLLLKPIVVGHQEHAVRALDLLWSLDAFNPSNAAQDASKAITAIAEAATITFREPIEVSERVLAWLEQKIKEPSTIERVHRKPWILSALLKPFFVREVQDVSYSGKGNTVVMSRTNRRAEKGRPLRQRALTLIETFLQSPDTMVGCALVPVLGEGIKPIEGWLPWEVTETDRESWRQDCLNILKVIEIAVEVRQDSPTLLLKLRSLLRNHRQLDQDSVLRGEKDRILTKVPDTLELRVARALTSYAHIEYKVPPGQEMEAETEWAEFVQSIAVETFKRFKTAHEVCEFLRRTVEELNAANESPRPAELFQHLAQIAPHWCGAVLKELVGTENPALDGGVRAVLFGAVEHAPEAYRESLECLPTSGRSAQVCQLIRFLGWKQANLGGLTQFECEVVMSVAKRSEESVVCDLAWLCGFCSRKKPKWAMDVLSQLQPAGERSGSEIMLALGRLVEDHASDVEPQRVALCLANVGEYCFPESSPNEFGLSIVVQRFPKEVYEHVRRLCEQVESDSLRRSRLRIDNLPSLGPIGDAEYTDQEIRALWERATASEQGSFSQEFRVALIRSLLWSDASTAPDRLHKFVIACQRSGEIKLLARLAATKGSRFVFAFPDIVRSILARGQNLGVMKEVTTALLLSAVGGSRSYTDSVPDPEYKYIREQGHSLANRHQDDPLLSSFYRAIAESERRNLE